MKYILPLLINSVLAFSSSVALAQSTHPAAISAPTAVAPAQIRIVAPTIDPLVQRREDNALANEEYKNNKKQAKQEYQNKIKAAETDRTQLKHDAAESAKAALANQAQR